MLLLGVFNHKIYNDRLELLKMYFVHLQLEVLESMKVNATTVHFMTGEGTALLIDSDGYASMAAWETSNSVYLLSSVSLPEVCLF